MSDAHPTTAVPCARDTVPCRSLNASEMRALSYIGSEAIRLQLCMSCNITYDDANRRLLIRCRVTTEQLLDDTTTAMENYFRTEVCSVFPALPYRYTEYSGYPVYGTLVFEPRTVCCRADRPRHRAPKCSIHLVMFGLLVGLGLLAMLYAWLLFLGCGLFLVW
jgi:hypothetical protein